MELLEYYARLMRADWSYEFSEDMSAYTKGKEENIELRKIAKEKGIEFKEIYNKVAKLNHCRELE